MPLGKPPPSELLAQMTSANANVPEGGGTAALGEVGDVDIILPDDDE